MDLRRWLARKILGQSLSTLKADWEPWKTVYQTQSDWHQTTYAEYYPKSVPVYSAIKVRAQALARPSLRIYRNNQEIAPTHPLTQIMEHPNPWTTRNEFWQLTETILCLWGACFWIIETPDPAQPPTLWPVRPDRMQVVPSQTTYIQGYVYNGTATPVAYTNDEVVWLRYPNPLNEHAGTAPIAPIRLVVDMAMDAQRYNRVFFQNSSEPGMVMMTDEDMTDKEVEEFYKRWDIRYQGAGKAHRPALASFVKDIKTLQVSQRDSEFLGGLRWALEEVARVYQVPLPLVGDYSQSALSNMKVAERMFWTNCMLPEMRFLAENLSEKLFPRLSYQGYSARFRDDEIEALTSDQDARIQREINQVNAGILTLTEVRKAYALAPVPWGNEPPAARQKPASADIPSPTESLYNAIRGNTNGKAH